MGTYLDFAKKLTQNIKVGEPLNSAPTMGVIADGLHYPDDLWSPGQEPFIYFNIRNSVAADLKSLGNVSLYMPPTIAVRYESVWSELEMQSEKTKALSGFDVGNLAGNLGAGNAEGLLQSAMASIGNGASREQLQQLVTGNVAGSTLGGESVAVEARRILSQGQNTAVNPFISMVYGGPKLREFMFNFTFSARSKSESDQITMILKTFKSAMHPDTLNNGKLFYVYPYVFDIFLITPSTDRMFNIKRAALTGMNIDYAGSGIPSFFKESYAPVDIRASLQFKELDLLTKDDIENNY